MRLPDPGSGPWVELEAFSAFVCGIDGSGRVECWHDLPGDWTACGVTLDGRGVCFPAPYEQAGDQQVPDLEDLVLP